MAAALIGTEQYVKKRTHTMVTSPKKKKVSLL